MNKKRSAQIVDLGRRRIQQQARRTEEGGWEARNLDPSFVPSQPVCLYAVDRVGGNVVAGLMNLADLQALPTDFPSMSLQETADALGSAFFAYGAALEKDKESLQMPLIAATALYVTRTQTFDRIADLAPAPHLVVIGYPSKRLQDRTLRPFGLKHGSAKILIDAAILTDAVDRVEAMDREAHPEWFLLR